MGYQKIEKIPVVAVRTALSVRTACDCNCIGLRWASTTLPCGYGRGVFLAVAYVLCELRTSVHEKAQKIVLDSHELNCVIKNRTVRITHIEKGANMNFVDKEWEEAEKADEPFLLYKCQMSNGGTCFKQYKPSIATLVKKRTGLKLELVETVIGYSNMEAEE